MGKLTSKHARGTKVFEDEIFNRIQHNVKLSECEVGVEYRVNAVGISTKGNFGDSPFFVSGDTLVWLPKHCTETIKEILADPEEVQEIKAGTIGVEVVAYTDNNGVTRHTVAWFDCASNVDSGDLPFLSNGFLTN